MPLIQDSIVPEYKRNLCTWDKYRRMLAGGREIAEKLPKISPSEETDNYINRLLFAINLASPANELQRQLDILTTSGFEIKTDNPKMNEFLEGGVDGNAKTFTQWLIDDVLYYGLAYGSCFPVIDRQRVEVEQLTIAQAEQLPNPYGYVLTPMQVQAWKFASPSEKSIIRAISKVMDVSCYCDFGFPSGESAFYTLWDTDYVALYNDKGEKVEERMSQLSMHNMTYFELSESFFHDIWDALITSMQHFTIASKAGQNQIGLLVVSSNTPIPQVDVGNNAGLRIPEKGTATMISSPVEGIQKNLDISQLLRDQISRQLKNNMVSMSISRVEQSGESKKQDNLVQEAFSHYLANQLVSFAPQVLDRFAEYLAIDSYSIDAFIPEQFVSKSLEEDRLQAQYLSSEFRPQTATQYKAWTKALRDLSGIEGKMSADELTADDIEIEAQAQSKFDLMNSALEMSDPSGDEKSSKDGSPKINQSRETLNQGEEDG